MGGCGAEGARVLEEGGLVRSVGHSVKKTRNTQHSRLSPISTGGRAARGSLGSRGALGSRVDSSTLMGLPSSSWPLRVATAFSALAALSYVTQHMRLCRAHSIPLNLPALPAKASNAASSVGGSTEMLPKKTLRVGGGRGWGGRGGWGKNEGSGPVGLREWIGPVFAAVFTPHARQTGLELGKQTKRKAKSG